MPTAGTRLRGLSSVKAGSEGALYVSVRYMGSELLHAHPCLPCICHGKEQEIRLDPEMPADPRRMGKV